MIQFTNEEKLGYIPQLLNRYSPLPAIKQLNIRYGHWGGWRPFEGFTLNNEIEGEAFLEYAGDPPMREIGRGTLRKETIIVFDHAWVAVVQPNGDFEVSRMD